MSDAVSSSRIDGLDVARGVALIAMATFHFSWDLELFGYLEPGTATSGFLKYYARAIASSFLFIVGVSLVIATQNGVRWQSFLRRIGMVGAAALVISIATYFAVPDAWIFFGILHQIVFASLVGLIFVRLNWAVVLVAAIVAFALPYMEWITTDAIWLNFFGLFETQPRSNDFVPVFPWLSASLTGIAAAKLALANGWVEKFAKSRAVNTPARELKFLGQHSLMFYLIHQPVLIGVVWLASQIMPPKVDVVGADFQSDCLAVCSLQNNAADCAIYCDCFENELRQTAAQTSQLPVVDNGASISVKCSQVMRDTK